MKFNPFSHAEAKKLLDQAHGEMQLLHVKWCHLPSGQHKSATGKFISNTDGWFFLDSCQVDGNQEKHQIAYMSVTEAELAPRPREKYCIRSDGVLMIDERPCHAQHYRPCNNEERMHVLRVLNHDGSPV